MIMPMMFDAKNYDLCKRVVKIALKAKKKLGFIDKRLTRLNPETDEEFLESYTWDMANSMLCSWLLTDIDPKLRMSIAYFDMAKVM